MADQYINRSVDLTVNTLQTLYTVPTTQITNPPQDPVTAIIKNILVCNDSGSAATLTVLVADASLGPADIKLFNDKSIGAGETVELINQPLVLEDGDVLKVQASTGNAFHISTAILQIT